MIRHKITNFEHFSMNTAKCTLFIRFSHYFWFFIRFFWTSRFIRITWLFSFSLFFRVKIIFPGILVYRVHSMDYRRWNVISDPCLYIFWRSSWSPFRSIGEWSLSISILFRFWFGIVKIGIGIGVFGREMISRILWSAFFRFWLIWFFSSKFWFFLWLWFVAIV